MLLYTTALPENIFAQDTQVLPSVTVVSRGLIMEVLPLKGGGASLARIYSTDPANFLNPALAPGSFINTFSET